MKHKNQSPLIEVKKQLKRLKITYVVMKNGSLLLTGSARESQIKAILEYVAKTPGIEMRMSLSQLLIEQI